MFKDTRKELERLEAELLQEEAEQEAPDEDALDADPLLDDPTDFGEDSRDIYRNYANRHYQAYNNDVSDEDLDVFSEEVYQPKKRPNLLALCIIALLLTAGILAVLAYWALRLWG